MIFFEKLKQNLCKILWEKQIGLSRLIAVVANTLCNAQEKWKTKVMLNFGGQTKCIMGGVQMANSTTRPPTLFPGLFPSSRHFLTSRDEFLLKLFYIEPIKFHKHFKKMSKTLSRCHCKGNFTSPGIL